VSGALALFASCRQRLHAADRHDRRRYPLTLGQPDQGYEGNRFTGIPLYDALVSGICQGEKPSGLVPGLATEWHVDPQNQSRWIFTLRPA
jgi:peptide/nickel transport system substrate-binding protein